MLLDLCVHIDQHRDHIFSYSQILFHLHYRIRPESLLCHLIISSYLLPFCGGGESNFEKTFLFMPTGADQLGKHYKIISYSSFLEVSLSNFFAAVKLCCPYKTPKSQLVFYRAVGNYPFLFVFGCLCTCVCGFQQMFNTQGL